MSPEAPVTFSFSSRVSGVPEIPICCTLVCTRNLSQTNFSDHGAVKLNLILTTYLHLEKTLLKLRAVFVCLSMDLTCIETSAQM